MKRAMTIQELRDLVAAVQFRRGWALTMRKLDPSCIELTVTADVEDAYHEHALGRPPIRLRAEGIWTLEEVAEMNETTAIKCLWQFIREADEHEAREWFRVRGVRVLEPHEGTR